MSGGLDAAKLKREMLAAQRRAEAQLKREIAAYNREIDRVNRQNQRQVDAYNRKVDQHNRRVVVDYNRQVDKANAHNSAVIAELNRQLRGASSGPRYTSAERALTDRVQHAVAERDDRECDTFLSYARIDGAVVGEELRRHPEGLGVSVWFDAIAITPGKSQARQIPKIRGFRRLERASRSLRPLISLGDFGPSVN